MSQTVTVDIVGDHPHAGRRGTIALKDGKVTTVKPQPFLPWMVRVEFENGEAAFAEGQHVKRVWS